MIYPSNFEQKTGFDKVRLLVSDKCLSPLGKERVAAMSFSTDYAFISNELDLVDEFVKIQQGETDFSANYFFDVRYSLKRIRPEGTWMDEKELADRFLCEVISLIHVHEIFSDALEQETK